MFFHRQFERRSFPAKITRKNKPNFTFRAKIIIGPPTKKELYYLNADLVGDKIKFVRDNQEVSVTFHEDIAISLELPAHVVLQVTEAEISAKGDTVTNDKKGAVCETGLAVRVPPYIDSGEWIKVHTDTGDFLSRADGPDA